MASSPPGRGCSSAAATRGRPTGRTTRTTTRATRSRSTGSPRSSTRPPRSRLPPTSPPRVLALAHHLVALPAGALEADARVVVVQLEGGAARRVARSGATLEGRLHADADPGVEGLVDVVDDRGGGVADRLLLAEVHQAAHAAAHERVRGTGCHLEAEIGLGLQQHVVLGGQRLGPEALA